jgi:hypothetical protein
MTAFQVLLIVALAALLVGTVAALVRGVASRGVLAAWTALWAAGLAAAIWPDATTSIANALGIERGKDLLLYCTTVAVFVGFFMLYVRLRRVRRDLTIVSRRMAMIDVHENPDGTTDEESADHADDE